MKKLTLLVALLFLALPGWGAVTVTYEHPVAGATPPTASEAKGTVVATVTATADADVAATITHNLAISAADLAKGLPIITVEIMQAEGWVSTPYVTTANKTTNAVVVTMSNAVGSGVAGAQFRVTVQRLHSIGR